MNIYLYIYRERKSTKYIQQIFLNLIQIIIIPTSHLHLQKFKITNSAKQKYLPTISTYISIKINLRRNIVNVQNFFINNNTDPVAESTVINIDNTNVRGNHNNIGTDKEHNNKINKIIIQTVIREKIKI